MALDNRSVTITLKLDSGDEGTGNKNPVNTESTKQSTDKNHGGKALAVFAVAQAAETALNEMVAWGEYNLNKELTLNDDYIGQRNKNIAMTQLNRGISAISTIVSSTASGAAMGGPVGAAIGFAIGTAASVLGIARSNSQGQEQQNIMLRQMDAQLDFTRSRAGWSLKAASIGEDL